MDSQQKPKVVALVPLRGGSKSIRYKNIKDIGGKPLAYWVLKAATDAKHISDVYVSTEDARIKEAVHALDLGVKVIDRPPELAEDLSTTDSVMLHFIEQVPQFDILCTIQATSPLTTATDIDTAIETFLKEECDSMLTGVRVKRFFWSDDGTPLNYDPLSRPMRQQFKGTLMENGAFYLTRKEILEKHRNRLGGKIGVFEMSPDLAVELDEPEDWQTVERILLAREKRQ